MILATSGSVSKRDFSSIWKNKKGKLVTVSNDQGGVAGSSCGLTSLWPEDRAYETPLVAIVVLCWSIPPSELVLCNSGRGKKLRRWLKWWWEWEKEVECVESSGEGGLV